MDRKVTKRVKKQVFCHPGCSAFLAAPSLFKRASLLGEAFINRAFD